MKLPSEIISDIGWCQGAFGKLNGSNLIEWDEKFHQCDQYCTIGAIHRYATEASDGYDRSESEIYWDYIKILGETIGVSTAYGFFMIAEWNDNPFRTREEVIEKLIETEKKLGLR